MRVEHTLFSAKRKDKSCSKAAGFVIRNGQGAYHENNISFDFTMEFGAYAQAETKFGGVLEVLIPKKSQGDLEAIIYNMLMDKNRKNTHVLRLGGESSGSAREWVESVFKKPIALHSDLISISQFCGNVDRGVVLRQQDKIKKYLYNNFILSNLRSSVEPSNQFINEKRYTKTLSIIADLQTYACVSEKVMENLNEQVVKIEKYDMRQCKTN